MEVEKEKEEITLSDDDSDDDSDDYNESDAGGESPEHEGAKTGAFAKKVTPGGDDFTAAAKID